MDKKGVVMVAVGFTMMCSGSAFAFDILGGVAGAASNVITQVTERIGDVFAQPQDIEKERTKLFEGLSSSTQGLSETQRTTLLATGKAQWPMIEHQLLIRNAQIAQRKSAPIIDVMAVAKAGAGSIATSTSIAAVTSPSLMQSALSSGAMDGVMSGLSNAPAKKVQPHGNYAAPGVGGIYGAQLNAKLDVANATQTTISNSISNTIKSILHLGDDNGVSHAELTDAIHPDDIAGKKPDGLQESELYALCGNLGWHQEKADKKMQFYAPVIEDPTIIGVVFTLDGRGGVTGAAKFVKLGVADFATIVNAVKKQKAEDPRYSSSGNVSRAVWKDGTFVSVDTMNFSLGWSKSAINMWNKSGQI